MGGVSFVYPMLIAICLFIIASNVKNSRKYKKENMNVLFNLNEDDKTMRIVSSLMLVFLIISSIITLADTAKTKGLISTDSLYVVLLPLLFIILYLPMSKKTRVTTLGIFRRTNLIRWEDIKVIDYLKQSVKGKQLVKILYRGPYKDLMIAIAFKQDDEQYELFKNTAKEYRNNKKDKHKDNYKEK